MIRMPTSLPTLKPARGLAETLKTLTARVVPGGPSRLVAESVSPNPGDLRFWQYRPADLPRGAPLVVVLHGCGQTAGGFDAGTGWSQLADRAAADGAGFALLFPEQQAGNNPNTCFNWFDPADAARGRGEVASIAAAVTQAVKRDGLDPARVFVTGLSAGGAMAAACLACYPELFAAGAVVAGLPFGTAGTVREGLDAMFRGHTQPPSVWGRLVRDAGPAGFRGPWPRVAIWHGTADTTVRPVNGGEAVKQWLDVHGLGGAGRQEAMEGASRTVWRDRAGRAAVEQVMVAGLAHGVPVSPGVSGIGAPAPYILEAGVSSTEEIARFFDLVPAAAAGRPGARPAPRPADGAGTLSRLLQAGLEPLLSRVRPPS